MTCGECKHYEPARNPDTNRPLPSQPGHCRYVVEWPTLPKAYLTENAWNHRWGFVLPERRRVEKDDERNCDCFKARG